MAEIGEKLFDVGLIEIFPGKRGEVAGGIVGFGSKVLNRCKATSIPLECQRIQLVELPNVHVTLWRWCAGARVARVRGRRCGWSCSQRLPFDFAQGRLPGHVARLRC